jgi:hypothetical protein
MAVRQYLSKVFSFLQRLLLLIHLTGGQPARGTELLCIRWRNSTCGQRRNIFIENGLVSFVTTYHKGYSMTGTIKIIHRFLPLEVGELVVYYLWMVVPFLEQLQLLCPDAELGKIGSFLWCDSIKTASTHPPRKGKTTANELSSEQQPWPSSQLSQVITREFQLGLNTKANILAWRHVAIAISRKHLSGKGFKRDFNDDGSAAIDLQAGHDSQVAGNVYAREIEQAPGHISALRDQFRSISRKWHICLGFNVPEGDKVDL